MKAVRNLSITGLLALILASVSWSVIANTPPYSIALSLWTGYPNNLQGFKDGLKESGLEPNKDVIFIQGPLTSDRAQQKAFAESLVTQNPDLVYSLTTSGTVIVKESIPDTTPIVFSIVTYPADSGLIDSFEYSGNNLVGTSNYIPLQHYLSLIDDLVPETKRAAIFHRKGEPNSKIQAANLTRLLKRKNIDVIDVQASDLEELRQKAELLTGDIDLFITTTDTLLQNGGEEVLIDISTQYKIPILSSNKSGIQNGATFGPVSDFYELGRQAAFLAAEILTQKTKLLTSRHRCRPNRYF
ncbi:ABC transporter substrate-binding protein [Vibrio sonorensis]|uniref:ABC transporter substrate-binding protein n=1 Tax=Vibrio sonorensis TaxID=1004316 RepID=UPI0008D98EAF|nr:ABC transporter substrate-binding protein [Vibrio sonorensis]